MAFSSTDIDNLLKDKRFRIWVFNPSPELEEFWNNFLKENPEKREVISRARKILLNFETSIRADFPDEAKVTGMYDGIMRRINRPHAFPIPKKKSLVWLAVACVTALLGLAFWIHLAEKPYPRHENHLAGVEKKLLKCENTSSDPLLLYLPDSSCIHLSSGSKVSYEKDFGDGCSREVYLEGSAFFEIKKNETKPFYVYADELVTKVLGTSFHIQSYPEKDEVAVAVVTGKVSVTTREEFSLGYYDEMLLTPNQQALFERKTTSLRKSLVANPVMISKPNSQREFEFDDAPATKIFATIEKSYGVQISYNERLLGNCLLTASLTDETLFEMMDLLCMALGARYFVEGTEIIVTGTGCSG